MGAFMSFACGYFGSRGGIAAQIGKAANQDLFIGIKDGGRLDAAPLKCLPFFSGSSPGGAGAGGAGGGGGAADFQGEQAGPAEQNVAAQVTAYAAAQIRRHYGWATDTWSTADFTFTVYTPFGGIPDPQTATPAAMRHALMPAVIAELTVDNTRGTRPRTAFFAVNFNEPGWRPIEEANTRRRGFGLHRSYGVLGEVLDPAARMQAAAAPALFCRWSPEQGIAEATPHRLGSCPGLVMEVPAGQWRTLRVALGCYLEGIVTTGLEGRYFYTKYFASLEDVLHAALDRHDQRDTCAKLDADLLESGLSPEQQFHIAHATRSYYGSTQLLDIGGEPFWIVNEGEYCMMNTLDLAVDHMFWELEQNPWVVRNLLESFLRHYSFVDELKAHALADSGGANLSPGGISFTHDMGAHNQFSPHGQSSYELPDLPAVCFSHMTAEQLCNWTLMAVTYVRFAGDLDWARQHAQVFAACLESLQRRGGESAIPEFDSSRCGTGSEITTYDSLDHSLARTRNSLYMAVKFWASYIGLGVLFDMLGDAWRDQRRLAARQAGRAEQSILRHVNPDGTIPAVFEKESGGYHSRILPASEGLVYPLMWGNNTVDIAPNLCATLKRHTIALLKDPQKRNLFPDGGIRLSSTSSNSWMSKIAIFMHVAREVFQLDHDPDIRAIFKQADKAHVQWQTDGSGYWACSDQFIDGVARGSRWYPRIITSALWRKHVKTAG